MSRHFDFRHDGDVPLCGVTDDFADVVLRVEAAILPGVVELHTDEREFELKSIPLRQRRPASATAHFLISIANPESVIEMPVKHVELMHRHRIEVMLDLILREKMSGPNQSSNRAT